MSAVLAALPPLATALLFSGAIILVWRRRRAAVHALTWSTAFSIVALGWAVVLLEDEAGQRGGGALSAPRLCWLAAALLLVHGLRQRAGRVPRGDVLAAIWGGIAFGTAVLLGLGHDDPIEVAAIQSVLVAIGTLMAAIAVGPRAFLSVPPRTLRLEWTALLLLLGYAAASLAWAALATGLPQAIPADAKIAAASAIGMVAIGLTALLVLNTDLVTALERLARTDPLTNIWNRRGFDEAAQHLLQREPPGFGPVATVAIADIDAFKAINDRFGHAAGDAVLVRFAEMLQLAVQPGDLLARLGGEEFALLALRCDGPSLFSRVERARMAMAQMGPEHGAPLPVTASFGVAELTAGDSQLRHALERADKALYRAKSEGRNRSILAELPKG